MQHFRQFKQRRWADVLSYPKCQLVNRALGNTGQDSQMALGDTEFFTALLYTDT
ncbi:hypothetical protein UTI89UKE1_057 [Escherichia phage vB_EcoS-UTI89UKE1]|uniref:Uncharacterized protein n=1 Tax=Escherichia phage vB_EcoS-UTI89UKE1 TaxID=2865825 RepID=A0A9E7SIQ5_9CAUD|nr:hypothetical protein UTI89UKE1_057 [Escherichia phage vB_EcoS-UTI89UKE1]